MALKTSFFKTSEKRNVTMVIIAVLVVACAAALVAGGPVYNRGVDWLKVKTNGNFPLPKVKEVPFRLGLDLSGGTHLVYSADVSQVDEKDRSAAVEGVRDVIERRVNAFGVSEPVVQTNHAGMDDYRVIVELAGITDVEEAIKMIGETPTLEFKEEGTGPAELTDEEKQKIEDYNKDADKRAEEALGKLISGGDFAALARQYSDDKDTKEQGGDLGWFTADKNPEIVDIASKLEAGKFTTDLVPVEKGYEIVKLEQKRDKTDPFNENAKEKEMKASHILICWDGIEGCESKLSKEQAKARIEGLRKTATPANFKELAKKNSTEPGADKTGGELGWFGKGRMVKQFEDAAFALKTGEISGVVESEFGYHIIYKEAERNITEYKASHIFIRKATEADVSKENWKNTTLGGRHLKRATVVFDPNTGTPQVSLEFNDEGAKLFEEITGANVGKRVAIFLDGYIISAPTVQDKITGGKAVISGKFNVQEAKLLAQRLNAGALPVPISLISQQTVGASLGKQAVDASLRAGLYGLLFVALFMVAAYRFPGMVSVLSLFIYGMLVIAVFKLWPVTLTLAGIAGFIMSVGMAVDANVLIFARLKEELALGKPLRIAIDDAFLRAWPSIRDSNISTLITCFILAQFSTSVVKGFAITLALGIITSMFSAIFITKNFLQLFGGEWLEKRSWLIGYRKKAKVESGR